VELSELIGHVTAPEAEPLQPFDPVLVDFCDAVAARMRKHPSSREYPELLALAFWMRRAAVSRLAAQFEELGGPGFILAPRGLVFHIPPASVDTMFVYSLVMSLLVGNRNVIRLSQRRTPQVEFLLEALNAVLGEERFATVRRGTAIVSYGHELEPSTELSLAADVRVIWGGDATVDAIRALPLKPSAKELTFADRFSFAVVDAAAYLGAGEEERVELAQGLFNDSYWFDQMGCSSPRLLVWRGGADDAAAAADDLWPRLDAVVADRGYRLEPGAASAKLAFSYGSIIDRPVTAIRQPSNALTVQELSTLEGFDRTHPGAGFFFQARVDRLEDLVGFVARKDQTMSAFGFTAEDLRRFGRQVNGRGVDRIVPFGQALVFSRFWDGYDLLQELTRRIDVQQPPALAAA
jgi:hypothetical protein